MVEVDMTIPDGMTDTPPSPKIMPACAKRSDQEANQKANSQQKA